MIVVRIVAVTSKSVSKILAAFLLVCLPEHAFLKHTSLTKTNVQIHSRNECIIHHETSPHLWFCGEWPDGGVEQQLRTFECKTNKLQVLFMFYFISQRQTQQRHHSYSVQQQKLYTLYILKKLLESISSCKKKIGRASCRERV